MQLRYVVLIGAAAMALASVASASTGTIFAIAQQSPGSVTFSVGLPDTANAPANLSVTNQQYESMSVLVSSQDEPVTGWVRDEGINGWVGYATFAVASGLKSFAFVHKGGSRQPLAEFSYVAE